ncbi:hypothetical protein BC939DRAFT_444179 [Gamsiella multidivaricata]|uniref:uncharacterized protein n=1 Tax=Gamsiella multidivaricata TaxID=101098 RepID=UPI0022208487|nr:uncharacterized protein BC939DRAFT_444179 [Gamsiella multidivaricata]KAI7827965.1 hypothetical protein BC939DRAFT_444179 [Gamsiella multidivaricata]
MLYCKQAKPLLTHKRSLGLLLLKYASALNPCLTSDTAYESLFLPKSIFEPHSAITSFRPDCFHRLLVQQSASSVFVPPVDGHVVCDISQTLTAVCCQLTLPNLIR